MPLPTGCAIFSANLYPMLFTLTYVSFETRPFSSGALGVLIRQAARDNARDGITGVLLYADGYFVQRLEGPRDAVMDLFGRIRQDDRHEVLMLTDVKAIDARTFDGWGMALLDARTFDGGTPAQQDVRALLASLPETVQAHPDAVDEVATVLRAVLVA